MSRRHDSDHEDEEEYDSLGRNHAEDDEDEEDEDSDRDSRSRKSKKSRHHKPSVKREEDDDDEDDDDEDDDDDDEDDEDDEEEGVSRRNKRRKRSGFPFLDMEAEVDDEEEDEDEDDEEFGAGDGFIADEVDEAAEASKASKHLDLDRRRREDEDMDLEEQAARFKERYRRDYAPRRAFQGGSDDIPQQLLMPDVQSPHLWMVRCKPGKEKDIVFALMRKFFDTEYSAQPLEISSAFCRESLKGYIYIECMRQANVQAALNGLNNVFASKLTLVPIKEMTDVLKVRHKESELRPGTWVRIKRGKYANDLAQVLDIAESGDQAKVKLIPRLDMTPRTDMSYLSGNKRKPPSNALTGRPPAKLFNPRDAEKVDKLNKPIRRANNVFVWSGDTFRDGYLEKDMKISSLITENINPTLDEIQRFAKGGVDDEDGGLDLSAVALSAMSASLTSHFRPGENVEVVEGELKNLEGVVDSVSSDMIMIRPLAKDLKNSVLKFPPSQLRKLFREGDHVKVVNGKFKDETGLIIKIEENVVTVVTDLNVRDIQVFSKDLQKASNVASGTGSLGQYEVHDFVQLDASTVGVIYKIERGFARILDQNGMARDVEPHVITQKRDSSRAIATDGEGNSIQDGDSIREISGAMREGKILHVFRTWAFCYNREYMENNGVFVQSTRLLASMAAKSRAQPSMRLDTLNPAVSNNNNMNRGGGGFGERGGRGGGMRGGFMGGRGRGYRDALVDKRVTIIRGPHKGYQGIVKDATDTTARVELHTNCRILTVERAKLAIQNADGSTTPVSSITDPSQFNNPPPSFNMGPPSRSGNMTPMHFSSGAGSRTPAWNSGSKTPAWNSGSKTPAWSANARTPNPYADGGRTPAWDAGSKTPYHGGGGGGGSSSAWDSGSRTPASAWNAGSRTPASAWDSGSRTPAHSSWDSGSRTPATSGWDTPVNSGWGDNAGGQTPSRSASSSWDEPSRNGGSGGGGGGGGFSSSSSSSASAWDKPESGSHSSGYPQTPAAGGDWMSRNNVATPAGGYAAPSPAPYSGYPYTPGPSGYDSAPTPSSSNHFPSTPAASGSAARSGGGSGAGGAGGAGAGAGAGGASVATPATGGMSGGSGSSAASGSGRNAAQTPGANAAPQTPAGASATPMTPASHFPQTPFMPTGGDYSSGMDHHHHGDGSNQSSTSHVDWVATDIEVRVTGGASYEDGKYHEMVGRMIRVPARSAVSATAKCDVRLSSSGGSEDGKVIQVPIQYLEAVKPIKNDSVKVLTGQHRGNLGTLMGVDGEDAIVCFRGENMYNVLTMPALGKYLGQ
ncbi:transcription elongation factor spt5 [Actinomortierella ambigua]|uniref:Transcription elongation factor SPT5 n=1 Tax=Actinomortierella ambigua TaxID=1343610 RepID=A0A9P6Q9F3_9FUNG|nr:transcription elongation factor spt5 [Actinomortierella ambigua]